MKNCALFAPILGWIVLLLAGGSSVAAQAAGTTNPLLNVSSRVYVSATTPTPIVGFVAGGTAEPGESRWFLVRVIGPSLAEFGVPQPLSRPAGILYGQAGAPRRLGYDQYAFAQVVYPDGTTPESRFRDALRRAATASGAFAVPIPGVQEPLPADRDVVDLIELQPGAYTVHALARESGGTGETLVEVYALPADFAPQLKP
ncbi:MAG TPA: hypothetical protein VGD81_13110 [Opitutaceae bacterium]